MNAMCGWAMSTSTVADRISPHKEQDVKTDCRSKSIKKAQAVLLKNANDEMGNCSERGRVFRMFIGRLLYEAAGK